MTAILETSLARLSEYVASQAGWHYPKERWRDLARGVEGMARDLGFGDAEACVQWLLSHPTSREQIDLLARHLTVGETYFIRESGTFEALEDHILRDLIRFRRDSDRTLRIWTPGCCTGEEPYSLAILLDRMIPDLDRWNITILGTDINRGFLQKALDGIYGEWSFRGTPRWIKDKYFSSAGNSCYEIVPRLKRMVRFSYLNLKRDPFPGGLDDGDRPDLISCRNVLMYLVQEHADEIVKRFYQALADPGWLIVSASETSHVSYDQFETVNFPGAVFFKKDSASGRISTPRLTSAFIWALDERVNPAFGVTDEAAIESNLEANEFESPALPEGLVEESVPEAWPVTYETALDLYERGSYAEAAQRLETTLLEEGLSDSLSDRCKQAITLLVRAYANQGKLPEALTWCRRAIASDKLNAAAYYLLATILQEQGEIDEAIGSLNKALYLDQNFVIAHFALGNNLLMLGKAAESRRGFESAITLLSNYRHDEVLAESEGMTAGRLAEIVNSIVERETF